MEEIENINAQAQELAEYGIDLVKNHGPDVVLAIVTLILGLWVINRVVNFMGRALEARSVEPTLARFLRSLANIGLKVMLAISVIQMLGVEATSFIAVLGAAGLAVGLALQGSLANFAGGVLILLLRPFKVGDVIDAQGILGTVHEIGIFHTLIKTFDNRAVIVPNGNLSNNVITNVSREPTRRVDWTVGVSYDDDILKVKDVIKSILDGEERLLAEPAPVIALHEFADSSINFVVRAWVNAPDLWPVFWAVNEQIKLRFDEENISIPFPQRDVHVYQEGASGG